MKITALAVERAGVLDGLVVRRVSPGLTVWTGANESGKTTLFELLRAALFGLSAADRRDRRGEAFRELLATARGVRVEVETGSDDRPGDDPRLLEPLESRRGDPRLAALWGGLDPATASRLHAVDAETLASLDLLTSADHRARLAGALAGAESLPGALCTLDRRLADLLKPGRAKNPTIDATTRSLADLDRRLAHLRQRSESYRQLVRARRELEHRADELATELRELPPPPSPEPTEAPVPPGPQTASPWPRLAVAFVALVGLASAVALGSLDRWSAAVVALAVAVAAAFFAVWTHRRPRLASEAPLPSTTPSPEKDAHPHRQVLEARLADTWREIGSLDHEARALETSDDLATALARRETVRATRADAVASWATAALARTLLEKARERSEDQRVPRVLARASSLLQVMTGDRDLHLLLDREAVALVGLARGTRGQGAWSTGLADLVELAVRWALLREMRELGETTDADAVPAGPLLLDDVHLRLDPERRRHLALALLELARERQVMAFSCQPGLARDVEELLAEGAGGGVAVDLRRL